VVGQELQEQMQAVLTEEPEETGFNMIYQELTLFTPVVVAAVATTAAPARSINSSPVTEPFAIAAASMARIWADVTTSVIPAPFRSQIAHISGVMPRNQAAPPRFPAPSCTSSA
jgi:hypothetical protein